VALTLVLATLCAYAVLDRVTETGNHAGEQVFPFAAALFGSAAIIGALRAETAIRRLTALGWLGRYLGRVSYSTYLFHIILIELIGAALPALGGLAQLALFLIGLFGFTTLFYVYFERPILAARPRYRSPPPPALDTLTAVSPVDRQ